MLEYNPNTGLFHWLDTMHNAVHIGDEAGSITAAGYIYIGIDGRSYAAHVLAWFYVYEVWPSKDLDHYDTIKTHNWITNLREATVAQNQMNKKVYKNNVSGFKGVAFHQNSWRARLGDQSLGNWEDKEMAISAAIQGRWDFHGEFARYN